MEKWEQGRAKPNPQAAALVLLVRFELNGGDDGNRTRGLGRESRPAIGLYNLQDRRECQGPPELSKIAQDAVFCELGCGLEILRPKWRGLARHRPIDRRRKGDQTSTAWPKFLPRYQSRPKTGGSH